MPIATAQGRENAAAGYVAQATHMSLHASDPGSTGVSEVSGGAPAYARLPLTWVAGSVDGVYTATLASPFNVPAGVTVTHVGLWNNAVGGTFIDKADVADAAFTSQGTLEITSVTFTQS